MNLRLDGKRALVTGSGGGIGAAIARSLAREGVAVVVHGLGEEKAAGVVQEIIRDGGKAVAVAGDLGTDDGAAKVAAAAQMPFGGVDILVNNAGTYVNRGWEDSTPEQWSQLYSVNVLSMVRMIRHTVPEMKKAGWGRIVQMASGEATQPFAFMPDYAASKAAVVNLTVSLSKELAATGITVNTVSPGIIATKAVEEFYRRSAANRGWGQDWHAIEVGVLKEILPNTVGRLGTVEDVANVVTFLASPLSGYINGANYRVDGGSTVTIN
jgi:3-oxoacyl-[acyl-carrier protein] reductase